jgi:hypothetical protein
MVCGAEAEEPIYFPRPACGLSASELPVDITDGKKTIAYDTTLVDVEMLPALHRASTLRDSARD